MTDKELADKIVALGVGTSGPKPTFCAFYYIPGDVVAVYAEAFVDDWRVAGALTNKCHQLSCWREDDGRHSARAWKHMELDGSDSENQDSRARAIIEACVAALEKS